MVFVSVPMTTFAADRDTSSLEAYLSAGNLANAAETILTDLGERKTQVVPTILTICCQAIKELKEQAKANGVDLTKPDADAFAKVVLDYLDKLLAEEDINGSMNNTIRSIIEIVFTMELDLNSVDGMLNTIVGALDYLKGRGEGFCGDASKFNTDPLKVNGKAIQRSNGDLNVINALVDFLTNSDNIAVIKTVVAGEVDLGRVNTLVSAFIDLEGTVNGFTANVGKEVSKAIYEKALAEKDADGNVVTSFEESPYANFTCDETLAAALVKAIEKRDPTLEESQAVVKMTIYELIGNYADKVIANYIAEPLNTTARDWFKKIAADPRYAFVGDIINLDYQFAGDTFNFAGLVETGLFENLNNVVCKILEVMVKPEVYAQLGIKTGGNENISDNLRAFFGRLLEAISANNGGQLVITVDEQTYTYDFSKFNEEYVRGMSLEDMTVQVLSIFYPDWFGKTVPEDVTNLEKLSIFTGYIAIEKWMPQFSFLPEYKEMIFNADGTVKELSGFELYNMIGSIGMDVAVYWLNRAEDINAINIDPERHKALKDQGWAGEEFFEEIVDWALNYIEGFPVVADFLQTQQGVKDGFGGGWYKLNVVLNELLPLSFINGGADETFVLDTYTLIVYKGAPALFDLDIAAFAEFLSMNDDPDNPFNEPIISSIVTVADHLLFSLFEYESGEAKDFTKEPTDVRDGYKGQYDSNNGYYLDGVQVLPALNGGAGSSTNPPETTTAESGTEPSTNPEETTTEPTTEPTTEAPTTEPTTEPEVKLGDLNGDGEVKAADARIALRYSARLEIPDDAQLAAADINKDGAVRANDARLMLRFSAKLITSFEQA